ncbi:MAG: YigZ family protein [Bacteroidales bacterium]|jgi:uncharacterized YigZ family protein|nr:YigZ family protein [Bacteroidales bacterium]
MSDIKDTYKTLAKTSEGYFRDKGSKFYAFAYPVNSEKDIKDILNELKKQYYDARHHCYAYRLGIENDERYRINEDGEPSGSAAKPIYGQILSHEITNVLIVVIRYFGGIKLGVPGLINAYKTASKEAIDNNEIVERILYENCRIEYKYDNINSVMRIIKDEELNISNQEYIDDKIITTIEIRKSKIGSIKEKFSSIYNVNFFDNDDISA